MAGGMINKSGFPPPPKKRDNLYSTSKGPRAAIHGFTFRALRTSKLTGFKIPHVIAGEKMSVALYATDENGYPSGPRLAGSFYKSVVGAVDVKLKGKFGTVEGEFYSLVLKPDDRPWYERFPNLFGLTWNRGIRRRA